MKVFAYAPEACLGHLTGDHPECPERFLAVRDALADFTDDVRWRTSAPATRDELLTVHRASYLDALERFAAAGGGRIDADTVISSGTLDAARAAAGAALRAADEIATGATRRAFCIVRPPGHHALTDRAMGFCVFNNAALAARRLQLRHEFERVLIVDFDVHHGNGTEEIFRQDRSVFYLSLHRWPFWPGTGGPPSAGSCAVSAAATLATLNVPLGAETPPRVYHDRLRDALRHVEARFAPEVVLLSTGFDAYAGDPVGGLNLQADDFARITETLVTFAARHAGGRVLSLLEGGYALDALPQCARAHVDALRSEPAVTSWAK